MRKAAFPLDEPLEKRSINLARGLTRHLSPADRTLTAPALRARQTAELLGFDAAVDDNLRDQNYGMWAGKALQEVEAEQPGSLATWRADLAYAPGCGESVVAVATRTVDLLDTMSATPGHTIAITHPAVVRTAMAHILGAPLMAYWQIDIPPLSVTNLHFDGTRWVFRAYSSPSRRGSGLTA